MRALLGVVVLLAFAGSAAAAVGSPRFRRADGSTIVFPPGVRAWCDRTSLNVVSLGRIRQSRWQLEVARSNVHSGRVVRFRWRHAHGISVFVYDSKTHNEASQGTEGSRGVVRLRRATCRRGCSLEIGLSGTIGSEFSDGKPIRISGTYRGKVGARPQY